RDLDAVDAAVALVDEVVIVGDAVRDWDTVGRIGAGPIHQLGDELLVLRKGWRGECRDAYKGRKRYPDTFPIHRLLHLHSEEARRGPRVPDLALDWRKVRFAAAGPECLQTASTTLATAGADFQVKNA